MCLRVPRILNGTVDPRHLLANGKDMGFKLRKVEPSCAILGQPKSEPALLWHPSG